MTPPRLLAEFPPHTYEQWHAAAEALLKGAPFEKRLVSTTYEDITIQPIYRREDIAGLEHHRHLPGHDSLTRGSRPEGMLIHGWEISQQLQARDASALAALIREALRGGQSELNINLGACPVAWRVDDFTTALDGVHLDAVSTYWRCGSCAPSLAAMLLASARQLGFDPRQLRGGIENDPLGQWVLKGGLRHPLETRFAHMAALTRDLAQLAPRLRTITVRGDIYHDAGASATQELSCVMATLATYIRRMQDAGIEPAQTMASTRLHLAIGSDFFMEIAKIRATRWLWSRMAAAFDIKDLPPIHIHASTSRWNKTCYDAHSNMLRVTSEAFAAVVAGVDGLHIGPYDEISEITSGFSRRIARNLHTILREECGLDRVIDPAGGSYYIEWLTDQVAARSWELMQDIERRGGMIGCLEDGSIQSQIGAVRAERIRNIRQRKDRIVGTNMYPDAKGGRLPAPVDQEHPTTAKHDPSTTTQPVLRAESLIRDAIDAATAGSDLITLMRAMPTSGPESPAIEAIGQHRAAESYEFLRDASAAYAARSGHAPSILQLNIGPSRKYRLRADWTTAFFEVAGFAVDAKRDFTTIDAALEALASSKAAIAVITSDDETYQNMAGPLAKAIRATGKPLQLLLAGAPGANEAEWSEAGIDRFVHLRSNHFELNRELLQSIGVLAAEPIPSPQPQ